jgi:cytochrome c-type protein NapB
MFSKKTLIAIGVVTVFIITGCTVENTVSEKSLGLRHTDLYSESGTVGAKTSYSKIPAGEAKVIDRAFENAPPMIPHDVEGLLPITTDYNSCLGCHDPSIAAAVNATSIPKSHLFDMRTQTMLDYVSQARYNCSQCHAPQSDNKLVYQNEFKADFRTKDGMSKSNLLENLNEGVR